MKQIFSIMLTISLAAGTIIACATSAVPVAPAPAPVQVADELDAAIREASDYLNKFIPKGVKVVILNIKSNYPTLSEYVIDTLTGNVVNDQQFTVVDRANLALIQQEMDFQTSGEVSDSSAQSIGQKLGAQTIVSGSVTAFGSLWRISVRALDVASAAVQGQFNKNIQNGMTIATLTGGQPSVTGGGTAGSGSTLQGGLQSAGSGDIGIEVTTSMGGTLYFQGAEVASLWEGDSYIIPIEKPGNYTIKMDFGSGQTMTRQVRITNRGIVKQAFAFEPPVNLKVDKGAETARSELSQDAEQIAANGEIIDSFNQKAKAKK